MYYFDQLIKKINSRQEVVGIIGLGYIGLPLLIRFGEEKIKTIGFDIDIEKVNFLNTHTSYLRHICNDQIVNIKDYFKVTNDFSKAQDCDVLIICVPTPLSKHREPNLEHIIKAISSIMPFSKKGQLISLESTSYPGTTEEIIQSAVEKNGYIVGEDFFITYSPEREDPGRMDFNTKTTPKICAGVTNNCLLLGQKIYGSVVDQVVPVSNTKTAEMTKLLENIHRAVNIALVNEMKIIADKMGIDIHEVIEAASTKPFGFKAFQPGPGLGGHCIPIDPFYLTWKAKELGFHSHFIELAGEINSNMPQYVVEKIVTALNERKIAANGSRVLVLGAAYKRNVEDMRESPALIIMELLIAKNVKIDYSDPYVSTISKLGKLKSVLLSEKSLSVYDAVVLITDHDIFDYDLIARHSKLIVDTRGRFLKNHNIVKA